MTEKTKDTGISPLKFNEKINLIKSISLIKISPQENTINKKSNKGNNIQKKYLGVKRKLFKKPKGNKSKSNKILSISKSINFLINNTNIKNNEICIICLEKISSQERHYLHCGHQFHCCCINKWLKIGKNKCPTCKQDIECNKEFSEDSISLEENDENSYGNIDANMNISIGDLFEFFYYYFLILLIIYFMFRGFCYGFFTFW